MTRTATKIKSAMVRARIEPELKTKAEKYFDMLGLSTTQAITLFYKQVELHQGLPFEITIPNAETLAAMKEIEAGGGKQFENAEELIRSGTHADLFKK
jgi:DNA-damage-inducible protein J